MELENGMKSSDGWKMDPEWRQVLTMMECIKFADKVGEAYGAMAPFKGHTQSYYQPKIYKVEAISKN